LPHPFSWLLVGHY